MDRVEIDKGGDTEWKVHTTNCGVNRPGLISTRRSHSSFISHNPPHTRNRRRHSAAEYAKRRGGRCVNEYDRPFRGSIVLCMSCRKDKTSDDEMIGEGGDGNGMRRSSETSGWRSNCRKRRKQASWGEEDKEEWRGGRAVRLNFRVSIELSMCIHKGTNSSGLRVMRRVNCCCYLHPVLLHSVFLHIPLISFQIPRPYKRNSHTPVPVPTTTHLHKQHII